MNAVIPDRNVDLGNVLTLNNAGSGTYNPNNAPNPVVFDNPTACGLKLVVNVTAISGTTPTLTIWIYGYDTASNQLYTLLTATAITAVSAGAPTVLTIYPSMTGVGGSIAQDHLPPQWSFQAIVGGTNPQVTATIGAELLV